MISGAVFTNPTVNPFRRFGLAKVCCIATGGVLASLARRISCVSGHRCATAMLIVGRVLLLSVDGLRKSTTSSFNLNEFTFPVGDGLSFSLNTFPQLLFFRNRDRPPLAASALSSPMVLKVRRWAAREGPAMEAQPPAL